MNASNTYFSNAMNETEIAEYLKKHLKIKINVKPSRDYHYMLEASILLDNTVISKDGFEFEGV